MHVIFVIKISISIFLATFLASLLGFPNPALAGMITLLCSQPTFYHPFKLGAMNITAVSIGLVLSLGAWQILEPYWWSYSLLIFIIVVVNLSIGFKASMLLSVVIALKLTDVANFNNWFDQAYIYLSLTVIGVGAGLISNQISLIFYRQYMKKNRNNVQEKISHLLIKLAKDVSQIERIEGGDFNELISGLKNPLGKLILISEQIEEDRSWFEWKRAEKPLGYSRGLILLQEQLSSISLLHREIRRFEYHEQECEYIYRLLRILVHFQQNVFSGKYYSQNDYEMNYQKLKQKLENMPLPKSGSDTSQRAVLHHIFLEGFKVYRKIVEFSQWNTGFCKHQSKVSAHS